MFSSDFRPAALPDVVSGFGMAFSVAASFRMGALSSLGATATDRESTELSVFDTAEAEEERGTFGTRREEESGGSTISLSLLTG